MSGSGAPGHSQTVRRASSPRQKTSCGPGRIPQLSRVDIGSPIPATRCVVGSGCLRRAELVWQASSARCAAATADLGQPIDVRRDGRQYHRPLRQRRAIGCTLGAFVLASRVSGSWPVRKAYSAHPLHQGSRCAARIVITESSRRVCQGVRARGTHTSSQLEPPVVQQASLRRARNRRCDLPVDRLRC
jgi:hypothetical protein